MDEVHILVEGYAYPKPNGSFAASPTTTLIETEGKKILVDPGTNAIKLTNALDKLGIKPSDIDFIYLTHYHPDHFLNLSMFPGKDVYDGTTLWRADEEYTHLDFIPGTHIEILLTPGHSPEHSSLLVTTVDGVVCIAQDVFWWEDGKQKSDNEQDLLNFEDPFASDTEALLVSRKLVLEKSDWIIPGHGRKFRNPKKKI
ncbi:MAG: MBL fold metallo-hydrolase [Microgenomates group bacterium]